MSEHTGTAMMVVLLLVVCGSLVYLDWRRQGEIDNLHARIDRLGGPKLWTPPIVADVAAESEHVGQRAPYSANGDMPTVERILRAEDDRTFADIARGNA